MKSTSDWLLAAVLGVILAFGLALVATVVGAFTGWIVGLMFPGTLSLLSEAMLDKTIPAWQLGAMLGFVGSFFRSSVSSSK